MNLKQQCGNDFDKWYVALSEGLLPHSYGNLHTKDHLHWCDSDFSAVTNVALEKLYKGSSIGSVRCVVYTYDVPLAIEFAFHDGRVAWLLNGRRYSRTSSKHRNFIDRVISAESDGNVMDLEEFAWGSTLPDKDQRITFWQLLPEWHGTTEELIEAVAALS